MSEKNQAVSLVPILGKAMVPLSRRGSDGKCEIGWQWAVNVGGQILEGELVTPSDSASLSSTALKVTSDAIKEFFSSLPVDVGIAKESEDGPVELPKPQPKAAPPKNVVTMPTAATPASQPQTEAPKRRGRPPGPAKQAAPPPQSDPDGEDFSEPGNPEPGDSAPDEPRGSSGRTLSELMNLKIDIGRPGGSIRGKTFTEYDAAAKAVNSPMNVDNVLAYIVNHEFTDGDGLHEPDTLQEQANNANELMELRKSLGLFKPAPPKPKK